MDYSIEPPQPTVPTPGNISPKKPIWKLLLLVFLLAAVACGLFWYLLYRNDSNNALQNPVVEPVDQSSDSSPIPTQNQEQGTSNEIAGWETYEDSISGFAIEYPSTARFVTDSMNANHFWIDLSARAGAKRKVLIWVESGVNQTNCSSDNFHFLKNTIPVTLNGINFIKGDVSDYYTVVKTKNYADQYCTKYNNRTYVLTSLLDYSDNANLLRVDLENDAEINKILSTFKFTK